MINRRAYWLRLFQWLKEKIGCRRKKSCSLLLTSEVIATLRLSRANSQSEARAEAGRRRLQAVVRPLYRSRSHFCPRNRQANLNHGPNVGMGSRGPSTTRRPLATAVWGVRRPYMRRTNVSASQ